MEPEYEVAIPLDEGIFKIVHDQLGIVARVTIRVIPGLLEHYEVEVEDMFL